MGSHLFVQGFGLVEQFERLLRAAAQLVDARAGDEGDRDVVEQRELRDHLMRLLEVRKLRASRC